MIKHGTFKLDYSGFGSFNLSRWNQTINMFESHGRFASAQDAEQRIKDIKEKERLDEVYRKDYPKYYD